MRLLLLLSFLACSVTNSFSTDYYVATSGAGGSDANSCVTAQTHTSGKATVNAGIDCLAAGDTLFIKAGTYNESGLDDIPSGTSALAMTTIRNYMTDVVTIQPTSSCPSTRVLSMDGRDFIRFLGNGSDAKAGTEKFILSGNMLCLVVIDMDADLGISNGNIFDGITISLVTRSGAFVYGADHTFRNFTCKNGGTNDQDHCLYTGLTTNMLIEDSYFFNWSAYGLQHQPTGGVGSDTLFQRNKCESNGSACFIVNSGSLRFRGINNLSIGDSDGGASVTPPRAAYDTGWAGIRVSTGPNDTELLYNTIVDVANGKRGIILDANSVDRTVLCGNLISGSGNNNQIEDISTGVDALGCNGVSGAAAVLAHNYAGDPGFTDSAMGDYSLAAGSPAIDNSPDTSGEVLEDYNEDVRPVGPANDYGAFEADAEPDDPPLLSEVYADSECSGCDATGAGTFASPYQTATKAVMFVVGGGTVFLRGRSTAYPAALNCDDFANGTSASVVTTIRGYPGDALFARITPTSGTNAILADASCVFVAFNGLRVFGTNVSGAVIRVQASGLTFTDVSAEDGPTDGWSIEGDDNTCTGCGASDNTDDGVVISGADNIFQGGNSSAHESDVSDNGGDGFVVTGADNQVNFVAIATNGANGILNSGLRALIQGNLIVSNVADGVDSSGNNSEIVHNTIDGNVIGIHIPSGDGALTANNALCMNGTALTNAGTNTVQTTNNSTCVDADFTNPAIFDYSLPADSDLIDAGTTVAGYPDTSYLGGPRESGDDPDIGAFEFQSPVVLILTSTCVPPRVGTNFSVTWDCSGCVDGTIAISQKKGNGAFVAVTTVAYNSSPYALAITTPATTEFIVKIAHSTSGLTDELQSCPVYGNYLK